ncbi:MAG TPA: phosphatidylglycerophosphatase A [Elusimicrobiales bacterium]|nr:phosphatidylglycerophosphatase A [Elusimicrobiales bacterium]
MSVIKNYPNLNFSLRFLASGFFISYVPASIFKNRKQTGAGLWGTLLALAFVPILPHQSYAYAIFLTLFILFSIWVCDKVSFVGGRHDDPKIIIDEVAGYWVAIAFLPKTLPILISALVLFRFFDTVKPFFIKKLDRLKGGVGIVTDDLASGLVTNIIVQIALVVIHYYNLKI